VIDVTTWNDFTVVANCGKRTIHVNETPGGGPVIGGFGNTCVFDNHNKNVNYTSKENPR
jgi:hypothetical protein